MDKKAVNSKKITIKGVSNGKTYNKAKTVKISSPGVIKWVKVNGEPIGKNTYKAKKNGKYTVQVKLISGATKKITFRIRPDSLERIRIFFLSI